MTKRKAKPKRGRPLSANPQTARITFAATPDAHARYKLAADSAGLALGTWLKVVADKAADKVGA